MVELRKLRGKSVLVSGGNAVNDLLFLYPNLFPYKEADFLTWLDESITDTSDTIVVCITPLTTTIATNAAINYKEF